MSDAIEIITTFLKNTLGISDCGFIDAEESEDFFQDHGVEKSIYKAIKKPAIREGHH